MQKLLFRKKLALLLATLCVAEHSVFAGSVSYDFNTDPTGVVQFYGNANWMASGGSGTGDISTNGFLQLTLNTTPPGEVAAIVFNDFDAGQVVQGFTFSCD